MIELFVNNVRIELERQAELALTFQAKDIESPDTFQSTFSINFNIPATPNNIKVFGFSNDINVTTNFPYTFQDIRLFYFGTEIIPFGSLYLLRYTNNYRGLGNFECRLFSGSLALFDAIEGKLLSDLDLSAINHDRDIATITASVANDWTDGYTYGVTASGLAGGTVTPSDRDLFPLLFYRYVFEQIIIQAGFTVSYRLFDNESIFNEILIAYSNDIQPRLATLHIYNDDYDIFVGKAADQVINTQLGGLTFDDNTTPPFFEGTENPFNDEQYNANVGGIVLSIEANLIIDTTLSGVDRKIQLVIFDTILSTERVLEEYDVGFGGQEVITVNKQVEQGYLGLTTYIRLRVNNTFFNSGQSITLDQSSTLKITVVDSAFIPTLWEASRHVPKISQKDFLKDALFRFGLLPQKDQFQNSIVVSEVDYLASLGFDDWSDKLDFTTASVIQYYPDGWFQNSVYELNDDDTIQPENTQSYELTLSDVKLPFRGEVWRSPFSSNGEFAQSPFLIPEIKRYTLKENETDTNENFAGIYQIARYSLYDTTKLNPRLVQRTSDDFDCIVLNTNSFLAQTLITFKALVNPEQQFQVQWLANILDDCKKITIDAYLSSLDVFEIDFSKPKYLKQFNSLFYLNKVNQWRGQDKPSELEFFKINETFVPPPPLSYALNFDGVNDYLQNDVSTPFTQWERTQASTFQIFFAEPISSTADIQTIIDTRFGNNFTGIFANIQSSWHFEYALQNTLQQVRVRTSSSVVGARHIAITYAGDSNANNINFYVDGVLVAKTIISNNLTSTITGSNRITVGFRNRGGSSLSYLNNTLAQVSIINYAKTPTEILADIAAGTQLGNPSDFLFRLPTIYKTDGSGNIATLDSTVPIPETAQNLDMNYFGYPNPLVLGSNLTLLP